MRIAVVGATGRIGAKLTRTLLTAGHSVKALSRGGPGLDALVALGAEPVLGSFDTGAGRLDTVFQDVDAAFLMVKTDWGNIHGHYPSVARRFVDALRGSSVRLAVSLTAIGSEVAGPTGHFESFYHLDNTLNELDAIDIVHLRAGWFMENMQIFIGPVARHGRIAWSMNPDVKLSWVATGDIAAIAARELTEPTGQRRVIRELGAEDLSMAEVAALIGQEIGHPVGYRFVDRDRPEVEATYLQHHGTPETWLDDSLTLAALNDGRVRFHGERPPLPTTMRSYLRDVWAPLYRQTVAAGATAETFHTWTASDALAPAAG